jgi:hypothetical protein
MHNDRRGSRLGRLKAVEGTQVGGPEADFVLFLEYM